MSNEDANATAAAGPVLSEGLGPSADNCSHCGFPLGRNSSGLRHYGTHTAHQESECLRLLHAEIASLKDAVRSARADEAHCWASRVDGLTAQLRELDTRYTALLTEVANVVVLQKLPPMLVTSRTSAAWPVGPNAK